MISLLVFSLVNFDLEECHLINPKQDLFQDCATRLLASAKYLRKSRLVLNPSNLLCQKLSKYFFMWSPLFLTTFYDLHIILCFNCYFVIMRIITHYKSCIICGFNGWCLTRLSVYVSELF